MVKSKHPIKRSELSAVLDPEFFLWATGIEDTFVVDPHKTSGRLLDEYELTGHYGQWSSDIDLAASLGVRYMRYGIPWYRIEPAPGVFDFDFPDRSFDRMLSAGVHPIVDLMHYGTPAWLAGSFADRDYPKRVSEYAARVGDRYRGRIRWYTPLNEPRITAYYCGKLGWWPPNLRSWSGFARILVAVSRGIVETTRALYSVDPEIVAAHVDATDVYTPLSERARPDAELRQELVFLALDLVTGKVDENHRLHPWLLKHGIPAVELDWFQVNNVQLDVLGLNLYPMFTNKVVSKESDRVRIRMKYADGQLLVDLADLYWQRYRTPMFVSETASTRSRRAQWLEQSLDAVRTVRDRGIPLFGYTWWPLFALVGWAYREGVQDIGRYLLQFGLWNLVADGSDLRRVPTTLVETFIQAVEADTGRVGTLRRPD